jgi:hypothetical protein
MNKWLLALGAAITLIGLGTYLSEYYALLSCSLDWCPTGSQLHPEILLLVPLGSVVIGYSFRRRGGTRPGNLWPTRVQASKVLPIAVVIAMVLAVSALASFVFASQAAGSTCAREVPSGSIVDPSADTVVLPNGSVVAIAKFPCSMTSVVWQTTGIAAIGQFLPLALVVVATTVLLYLVAKRRPMRDVEPSPTLRLLNPASWNGNGVSPLVYEFVYAREVISLVSSLILRVLRCGPRPIDGHAFHGLLGQPDIVSVRTRDENIVREESGSQGSPAIAFDLNANVNWLAYTLRDPLVIVNTTRASCIGR